MITEQDVARAVPSVDDFRSALVDWLASFRVDSERCEATALLDVLAEYGLRVVDIRKMAHECHRGGTACAEAVTSAKVSPKNTPTKTPILRLNAARDDLLVSAACTLVQLIYAYDEDNGCNTDHGVIMSRVALSEKIGKFKSEFIAARVDADRELDGARPERDGLDRDDLVRRLRGLDFSGVDEFRLAITLSRAERDVVVAALIDYIPQPCEVVVVARGAPR